MHSTEKQTLKNHLNLINTVNNNFKHISELELLIDLFKAAKEHEYWKSHFLFLKEVANQTFTAHYVRGEKLEELTLRIELILPEFENIYGEFEDNVEFKPLNDFYINKK